jgi:hypothetical protein
LSERRIREISSGGSHPIDVSQRTQIKEIWSMSLTMRKAELKKKIGEMRR